MPDSLKRLPPLQSQLTATTSDADMGTTYWLRVFDRDFVDRLLCLTWPEYLKRYKSLGDDWESPQQALSEFFLNVRADDDHFVAQILRSWTLRRTMHISTPKIFFLEQLLSAAEAVSSKARWASDTVAAYETSDELEEVAHFVEKIVGGFINQWVTPAQLRAVMKLTGSHSRDSRIKSALKGDIPQVIFSRLPPFGPHDRESGLSTVETSRLLRLVEFGREQGHLRDDPLASVVVCN